jgi:small-conductance mechanosensitive channel
MRIKFTSPPGEQFVLRKEILRRLQEAFKENNIEFAHRNVTVYLPDNEGNEATAPAIKGAATAAILNEEKK